MPMGPYKVDPPADWWAPPRGGMQQPTSFPAPPSIPATDPLKEAQMRRLAMAMMANQPAAGQQGQGGLFGGLAQGLGQGYRMDQQQEMNKLMGVESPWDKMLKMFGGASGGGMTPPGSMDYGGPR